MIETVDLDDDIGHLFVVDFEFNGKNATEKQLMYNEKFTPVIEKHLI